MANGTRRGLLVGLVLVALSSGGVRGLGGATGSTRSSPAPGGALPSLVDQLRETLLQQRSRIHSLHARLEMEYADDLDTESRPIEDRWVKEGTTELYYDRGKYRLIHHREVGTISEVFDRSQYVQWLDPADPGLGRKILRQEPPGPRARPSIPIQSILPVPEDKPISYLGMETVGGHACHVLLQSEFRYFIRADTGRVERVDVFVTAHRVGETATFSQYQAFADGIELPLVVTVEEIGTEGAVVNRHVARLADVEVNTPLSEDLFRVP